MQIVYRDFPIYNTDGTIAAILDGTYDAQPSEGQQPGWYALRAVNPDGTVHPEIVAKAHIVSVTT